jgi:UDP-glucose 4-epimerase
LAGVRQSVKEPKRYNEVNVKGTLNVLEAARDRDIRQVVYASSSSVYGKPEYLPYDEKHAAKPISPYGVSKYAAEQYTRMYYDTYNLPTVSLRYFTVYGPRMRPNMAITNFVNRCVNGEPPVIYGDGEQTRDFTYIDDIVAANKAVLGETAVNGEVMNIGSTGNISIKQLATEIRDQISPDLEFEFAPRHDADAEHTHADVSKARELIGYEPTTPIREGVSQFIDWYHSNRDWYEPLVRTT